MAFKLTRSASITSANTRIKVGRLDNFLGHYYTQKQKPSVQIKNFQQSNISGKQALLTYTLK